MDILMLRYKDIETVEIKRCGDIVTQRYLAVEIKRCRDINGYSDVEI